MSGRPALLIIDMLNDFDFAGAEALLSEARQIVAPINHLRDQARGLDVPIIYVNDNYGRWRDERSDLIAYLSSAESKGADVVRSIEPAPDDYFVIKPESSGFYATTLPALLPRLGVDRLVLTGIAADICVQFTAADAHMREYPLWVPEDAVAASSPDHKGWTLGLMAKSMSADVRPTSKLSLRDAFADHAR